MRTAGRHAKRQLDVVSLAIASIFALLLAPLAVPSFDQPAEASTPEVDQYLSLDGTNDYAVFGNDPNSLNSTVSDFTIEAWIFEESGTTDGGAVLASGASTTVGTGFELSIGGAADSRKVTFQPPSGGYNFLTFDQIIPQGEWVHLAVVYEAGTYDHTLFVNGVPTGTKSREVTSFPGHQSLFVGRNYYFAERYFQGKIDEVKVWKTDRTNQIPASMHNDANTTDANLVHYFNFNQGSGTATDLGSNSADLTLTDGASYQNLVVSNTVGTDTVLTFDRSYITSQGGWTPPVDGAAWEALMVAGGGAGGVRHGGGGGAGELLYTSNISFTGATAIQVGQGGPGRLTTDTTRGGAKGQPTIVGSYEVAGGGGGVSATGDEDDNGVSGNSVGGSNGGGSANSSLPTSTSTKETGPNSETGIGNIGGTAYTSGLFTGGGGGGASSAGQAGASDKGGDGGSGYPMNISGTTTCYAAGGGGGTSINVTPGSGGSCPGVGTSGGAGVSGGTLRAGSGLTNTGSGGGGGGFDNSSNSIPGSGGSGVVILRTAPVATVSVASSSLPNENNPVDVTLSARTPRSGYTYQATLESTGGGKLTMGSTGTGAVSGDSTTDYAFGFDDVTTVDTLRLVGSLATIRTAFDDVTFNMGDSTTDNTVRIEIAEVPDDINTNSNSGTIYYDEGRFYEFVSESTVTADTAQNEAKDRFVFNQPGYLVNITSERENSFIADRIDAQNIWIGASDTGTEKQWRWLDGPESGLHFFTQVSDAGEAGALGDGDGQVALGTPTSNCSGICFESWALNEPNGTDGSGGAEGEDYAVTNWSGSKGNWNDLNSTNSGSVNGYIAEFGVNTSTSTAGREFVRLFQAATQTVSLDVPTPVINTQPIDTTAIDRQAVFTVSASASSGTLSYQWQESTDGTFRNITNSSGSFGDSSGSAYRHYSGATSDTLTIKGLDYGQNGYDYRLVVTNTYSGLSQSVTSSAVNLTVGSSIQASEDAYIRFGGPTTNYGDTAENLLLVKETSNGTYVSTTRYTYLKFDFDNSFEWPSAVLDLNVTSLNGGDPAPYDQYANEDLRVTVYGIDSLDGSWPGEESLNWNNAPNFDDAGSSVAGSYPPVFTGSTEVGTAIIPVEDGNTYSDIQVTFSSTELRDLLNNSTDGEVFFILRRTDLDASANLQFSSSETSNPPILRFQSDSDSYLISYDLQGVSASGYNSQEFDGSNAVTLRDGSSLTPTGGGEFVEWNTQSDGGGTSYSSSASYSTKATLNLYAIYRLEASPTLSYSDATFTDGGTANPTSADDSHDGTKTFSATPASVCTVDSSTGVVSIQSAGDCTVTASYALSSNYLATSVSDTFSVAKANQATLNWDLSDTDVDYGSTLSLAVTGGSGTGAVSYTASGDGCSVSGSTLIGLDASESCSLTATKASDDSYNAASTSSQSITINKISQPSALALTSASTMTVPQTLELTAFGGDGNGSLSFQVTSAGATGCSIASGNELTATGEGTCQVTVTRAAGTNYLSKTSSAQSITVSKASQTIRFTSSVPDEPDALDTYTPTATASSGLSVSFTIAAGSSAVCTIAAGVVTFDTAGSCAIEADQSGNTSYSAATTVTQTIVVGKKNQNITFGSLSNKTWGSAAFQVSATASSSLAITYSADSSTTNSACTVSSTGLVTLGNVGTCVVKTSQAGDSTYAAANDVLQSFEVLADTPGAPFIGSVSFGDTSLTASFFKPTYLGGGTLGGYQLVAYEKSVVDGVVVAGSIAATNDACRASGTNNESCTIDGLTNGTDYVLKVAAVNQSGVGDQSGISQARTPASNPSAPQNLVAVQGDGILELSWAEPLSLGGGTFVEYKLYWREAGGSYAPFASENHSISNQSTTSYTIRDLTNGTSYDVKVLVTTSVNNAELESNTAEVVQSPYTVPNAPGSVVVIEDGERVIVSWTVPDFDGGNEIDGYNVKIDSTLECTLVSTNSCEITKPSAGSSVTISVEAENDAGASTAATAAFSVPGSPPQQESGGSGGSGGSGSQSGGNTTQDSESKIGFEPTPPSTPAKQTGPVGSIAGSSEEVQFEPDDSNEVLVASGRGWQVKVSAQSVVGEKRTVKENNSLSFPISSVAVFEGSGLKPNSVLEAWIFSEETYLGTIDVDQSGNLIGNIKLPDSLLPGEHTLQLGTENTSGRLVVLTIPVVVEGKVTVGTFKGFIAIFTKDLEGQRLSAKVAGRWLVQDPIDTFKDFGYSRVVRFTGAGYDILVDVYINRQFFERTTTRTR